MSRPPNRVCHASQIASRMTIGIDRVRKENHIQDYLAVSMIFDKAALAWGLRDTHRRLCG